MCRLKQWHPKIPEETSTAKSPGPRKGPGFGPRKVVHSSPKRWLVDTNLQIETVASKEHPQPRAPGHEKLFDLGPDSGPEKLFLSGPGFGPRKVV